jgi:molybdenum cofactor cytidylyltransferase
LKIFFAQTTPENMKITTGSGQCIGKNSNRQEPCVKTSVTAALITAAGMSSRMGSFKPLLKIGSVTIVERMIRTFREAGIRQIVLVCGNRAEELKACVASYDEVICLLNPDYKTTGMFESAKKGMQYLLYRCDRIVFTPVDIPLFSISTVKKLMESEAVIARPVYNNRGGHPILFQTKLVPDLLAYTGDDGLKGALKSTEIPVESVSVRDPGILYDADTPGELAYLKRLAENGQNGSAG